jgi:hypothetical protein
VSNDIEKMQDIVRSDLANAGIFLGLGFLLALLQELGKQYQYPVSYWIFLAVLSLPFWWVGGTFAGSTIAGYRKLREMQKEKS